MLLFENPLSPWKNGQIQQLPNTAGLIVLLFANIAAGEICIAFSKDWPLECCLNTRQLMLIKLLCVAAFKSGWENCALFHSRNQKDVFKYQNIQAFDFT